LGAKVDDLLANIRKSIDSDMESLSGGTPTQTRGTLMRGALREMRVNLGSDVESKTAVQAEVSDLRSRIRQKMQEMEADPFAQAARSAPPPVPTRQTTAVVPTRGDFSGILSGPTPRPSALRPSYAATETREDLRYVAPAQPQQWQEPEPYDYGHEDSQQQADPYAQNYEQQHYPPLISPQTEAHAETAFRQLSDAILARATGDRSLEDMTREMLKGMLKQWLDANLPAIVEDMVREEIQRVARRGR
jgi:cell pole-organizing protein PopZ